MRLLCLGLCLSLFTTSLPAADRVFTERGAPTSPDYFPIAVWLQSPHNAERYKAAGINLYVGLWDGPTAEQLAQLTKAGMPVICEQNDFAKTQLDNPIIAAWMHGDEPDNAQTKPKAEGGGYGPPILPTEIVAGYQRLRAADPSRPILLNLGQGVAWDGWVGRGERTNHPEDYPEYIKGCDLASFDIYPAVHDNPEVAGKLEFVGRGTRRLAGWAGVRPVWACIEASRIGNQAVKPTPAQIKSEVWMAIISGARGLIYFVHQFEPEFKEASLLDDPELLKAVTDINAQIRQLAPILNSGSGGIYTFTQAGAPEPAVIGFTRFSEGTNYFFTVNLTNQPVQALLSPRNFKGAKRQAEELETGAKVPMKEDALDVGYQPYEVRLFKLKEL